MSIPGGSERGRPEMHPHFTNYSGGRTFSFLSCANLPAWTTVRPRILPPGICGSHSTEAPLSDHRISINGKLKEQNQEVASPRARIQCFFSHSVFSFLLAERGAASLVAFAFTHELHQKGHTLVGNNCLARSLSRHSPGVRDCAGTFDGVRTNWKPQKIVLMFNICGMLALELMGNTTLYNAGDTMLDRLVTKLTHNW